MTQLCPNLQTCMSNAVKNKPAIKDDKCPKKRGKGVVTETCWRVMK